MIIALVGWQSLSAAETVAVGWQVKEQKQCAQALSNFQLLTFEDEFRKKKTSHE